MLEDTLLEPSGTRGQKGAHIGEQVRPGPPKLGPLHDPSIFDVGGVG